MCSGRKLDVNIVKYNDTVQKVRILAVFMVILSHAYPIANGSKDFLVRFTGGQKSLGNMAVQIFFF